jgi:hypothetical protein
VTVSTISPKGFGHVALTLPSLTLLSTPRFMFTAEIGPVITVVQSNDHLELKPRVSESRKNRACWNGRRHQAPEGSGDRA